jgi:hypothetical protein
MFDGDCARRGQGGQRAGWLWNDDTAEVVGWLAFVEHGRTEERAGVGWSGDQFRVPAIPNGLLDSVAVASAVALGSVEPERIPRRFLGPHGRNHEWGACRGRNR